MSNALHPRVAVLLGVNTKWHIPLLTCRALSTAPAVWWGLRCALTFLGELLLSDEDGKGAWEDAWSVEKRFRVTEVFLAILWVCRGLKGAGYGLIDVVLCVGVSFVFFYGLSDV